MARPSTPQSSGMGKGYHKKNSNKSSGGDLSSLRGSSCVIATCDVAREREATKELVNLLTQTIDELYPNVAMESSRASKNETSATTTSTSSIENLLAAEIRECSRKQPVISINSGVKGFVVAKIVPSSICPVKLVKAIFDQVEHTKLSLSRHLCRVVPLSKVFFANEIEFETNMKSLIQEVFDLPHDNTSDASVDDVQPTKKVKQDDTTPIALLPEAPTHDLGPESCISSDNTSICAKRTLEPSQQSEPLLPISILFKKRNHNTLSRIPVQQFVFSHIPRTKCTVDFKHPKVCSFSTNLQLLS